MEEKHPKTWQTILLGEFVKSEKGKKPKSQSRTKSEKFCYPYIDIEAFEKGIIKSWTDGTNCRFCYDDDFLIVWDGSRSGLVGKSINGALGSTLVRVNFPGIYNLYAYHFLDSKYLEINNRARGTGTPHVDPELLWNYTFPLPPLNEQKRIVEKIEELFSELDAGVESLKKAKQQLKIYRQSLLKKAFEGNLTHKWREENSNKLESAEDLIQRIRTERKNRYEEQIQNWQNSVQEWEKNNKEGKKPSKPRQPVDIPLTSQIDSNNLWLIPSTWKWCKTGQIFDVFVGATPSRKIEEYWSGDIPWISSGEVCFNRIKSTTEKITKLGLDNTSTQIHPAGTIILAMIGEGKTRGQASILDIEACHNQNTATIRVSESGCIPEFFYFLFYYRYEENRKLGSGNNQKALNKQRVSELPAPLCSLAEQTEIVRILEEQFSVIEQNEKEIDAALKASEALRQSILKKAFSGKLVPQDPNDEPASLLLERIQKERETQAKITKKKSPKKRAAKKANSKKKEV